jgi:serine/threonine protein kinase
MTKTLPCPEAQQLNALALGKLAEADEQTLRLHLEKCSECSALAAKLSSDLSQTDPAGLADQYATRHGEGESSATPPTALPTSTPGDKASCGAVPVPFLSPPVEPDEIGRLGPYRILRLLGRGGMGVVYQAEDSSLGRPVAIKILKEELADQYDPWERFLREARTLASIKHEHVVTVYHTGQEGRVAYLVMELLQGCSLAEHLVKGRQQSVADILRLGRELAAGLAVVHSHGLVHRDIKPANLWVEAPRGRLKILDFGLARMVSDDAHLTQTGVVVGTPAYMSPEQARGVEVDQRSDLFSLGCILYRLCTGVEPFRGPDTMSLLTALAVDDPCPVEELNPAIPKALSELVMHLLAKKPDDRPATAKDVIARLEAIEQSPDKAASPNNASDATPLTFAAGKAAIPHTPRNRAALRAGLLLGGGLLAGVVGGLFALRTSAEPDRPVKEKTVVAVETPREPPKSEDPDWQVQQRNSSPVVKAPRNVQKPTEPERQVRVYLSDLQPIAVTGWPPESPPNTAAKPSAPLPSPMPPPPPPPLPPPPRGPRDRPTRGGSNGPLPPDGPNGPPPGIGPFGPLQGSGANGPAAAEAPLTLSFPVLSVNGKLAPHGIGMQAVPKGKVGLSYALNGRFEFFTAEVSLNDTSTRSPVALTFSVYGDGERLWQSLPVTTRNHTQRCEIWVSGVSVLELTVTNPAGETRSVQGAHSIWIEPHVIGRK